MTSRRRNPQPLSEPELAKGETYSARLSEIPDSDGVGLIVSNGDQETIRSVRLHGIDAPEHDQHLGNDAADALQKLMGQHNEWRLLVTTVRDKYDRTVGVVYPVGASPLQSVNRQMVELGLAYWYPQYDRNDDYGIGQAELEARKQRKGVWKSSANDGETRPWRHRKAQEEDDFISEQENRKEQEVIAELEEAREQLSERDKEVGRLQEQLGALERDKDSLQRDYDKLSKKAYASEQSVVESNKRLERAGEQIRCIERQRADALDWVEQLHQERTLLQEALVEAKTTWFTRLRRRLGGR